MARPKGSGPSLVIADEPTTALDVTIQAQIVELIRRLQQEMGLAVIWISHDLGVIAAVAQTVNVMYAGYVVERGPVRSVYYRAHHPYTAGLLGSTPGIGSDARQRLRSIPGRPPDMSRPPAGCPFAPRCAFATARCVVDMPPVEAVADEHTVRCWNWGALLSGRAA
jgi:oligopeptide transport system ATP-binding protein